MAEEKQAELIPKELADSKAILVPLSDDGDPFKVGDSVTFIGWDGMPNVGGLIRTGDAYLGVIRAVNGGEATVEFFDSNSQPSGQICSRTLTDLHEYILPGQPDNEDAAGGDQVMPEDGTPIKAVEPLYHEIERANTAIKALDGDRFGGYLVVYGDPQHKDLQGEYFDKDTDYGLEMYDVRPALYHHGLNAKASTSMIGRIDKIDADEFGLWAEGEINKRNQYAKYITELVAKGALSFSSGSMPHWVVRGKNGRIAKWPIVEASMTPTPVEPRMTEVKHLASGKALMQAFKSLSLPTDLLEIEQEDAPTESAQDSALKAIDAKVSQAVVVTPIPETPNLKSLVEDTNVADIAFDYKLLAAEVFALQNAAAAVPATPTPPANPVKTLIQPGIKGIPQISVGDDGRYASMSASDLAFMTKLFSDAVIHDPEGGTKLGELAHRRMAEITNDQDRKMERRIAAKALRDFKDTQDNDAVIEFLPYKSLGDVDANNYRAVILPKDDEIRSGNAMKANELDTSVQTNAVADWVNQFWATDVIKRRRVSNPMLDLVTYIEMLSNSFYLPVESSDPTAYYMLEGSDLTMLTLGAGNTVSTTKVASDKRTLTATKLGTRVTYSTEVQEDALPFTINQINGQVKRVMWNTIDDTLLNGDTRTGASVNVNIGDGTPGAVAGQLPSYLALNGIRKFGLFTNTGQSYRFQGPPTLAGFRAMRATLPAQYALDLPNLAYVVDFKTFFRMLAMPEFLTGQNVGNMALPSAITGLLPYGVADQLSDKAQPVGVIDGIMVYVSAQIGLAQTGASGTGGYISTTGGSNITGTAILLDKSRWFFGQKRGIQVNTFAMPVFSDTQVVLATTRIALASFDAACAVIGYDIILT